MPSTSENALQALFAVLQAIPIVTVLRNESLGFDVPDGGALNLRDGDPGEPVVTMSPLLYHYDHMAELSIFADEPDADARFDALRVAVGHALSIDRTLGGAVDWVEAGAPAPEEITFLGSAPIKSATIPIRLVYATPDPLL